MAVNENIAQVLGHLSVRTLKDLEEMFPDNSAAIRECITAKETLEQKISIVSDLLAAKRRRTFHTTLAETLHCNPQFGRMADQKKDVERFLETLYRYANHHSLESDDVLSWPWIRLEEELQGLRSERSPKSITKSMQKRQRKRIKYTESVEDVSVFSLQSRDGETYILGAMAYESDLIKTIMERGSVQAKVPFPYMTIELLFRCVKSTDEIKKLDAIQFIDLHMAADFLHVKKVLELTNVGIAAQVDGKSRGDIKAFDDILNHVVSFYVQWLE